MIDKDPIRLGVLLSGGGRTLQNLAEEIARGGLRARITCVIGSSPEAYGLVRAEKLKLPHHIVARKQYADAAAFSEAIWKILRESDVDLVVLAGLLHLLTLPAEYDRRVVNIHPALLPAFGGPGMYGHRVHDAVLAAGCKISGCTVHFCDRTYDTGPIIVQRTCLVLEDDTPDTLAARVFAEECVAYPEAIRLFAEGRLQIVGRTVRLR